MIALLVAGAFSLVFTLFTTPLWIRLFKRLGWGQFIRDDGPQSHHTKRGTPTMGGIVFIVGSVLGYFVGHLVAEEPPTRVATLVIGIPGILFYALTRVLGITVTVQASTLDAHWWTVPVLILAALRAALQEEVIVVGYLFTRLRQLGWGTWTIILVAALLRGSYHLYQGFGPFVGNAVMGVVFGWAYTRWGRVMPLVVAHTIIDIVSFVGYPLAVAWWPTIFA